MIYALHPQATQDLADVVVFYQTNATARVAGKFLQEFERVAELLVVNPGFGTPFDPPRRIYPMRTYPYLVVCRQVVYRQIDDGIRIRTVRHERRMPSYGQSRS